ncbi:MAG TPA: aminotransferase class III-fold pyridoxal phosphate-dependent enzyme [Spirochaetia bacterium]|nr:aminotransferase class III-fold pyridoxal phosphate-dependent enzyme [Spirochaetia bacterium]
MTYAEIMARTRSLAARPALPPDPARFQRVLAEFMARTGGSARRFQQAGQVLPRGNEHAWAPSVPYPLFMERGQGSRVRDVDGNEYVDYILAGGPLILGHNPEGLRRSMQELIGKRTWFHGYHDEMEILAGQKILQHFPGIQRVRFTTSGTEANAAAARIARSFTGKKKIAKYLAGYHGWSDAFVTDLEIPGSGRILSQGIPAEVLDLTVLVPPNDLEALDRALAAHAADGGIAAVFCEPIGAESGLVPFREGFHRDAMEIAHRHGALYVFDEVVTGLRMGLGGAQAALGVKPDLTTLGKALMGGWPGCGAVGGRADVMETASAGVMPDGKPFAYLAGTFTGNTLSAAAAYYTFLELEKPGVLDGMFAAATDYVEKLNRLFAARGCGFFAYAFGGILRIEMAAAHGVPLDGPGAFQEIVQRRTLIEQYSVVLHARGVLSRNGRDMVSCSHTTQDNDLGVAAFASLIDILGA